ncbi:MAG: hypothetical protein IJJ44_12630 [Solobacterium sp.]|nr:hypothetical protein [Solobacterium sp.]
MRGLTTYYEMAMDALMMEQERFVELAEFEEKEFGCVNDETYHALMMIEYEMETLRNAV